MSFWALLFCSTDLCVCVCVCASTILLWWLRLCNLASVVTAACFLQFTLGVWGILWFHRNFRLSSVSLNNAIGIQVGISSHLSIDCFGYNGHVHIINSSSLWAWRTLPFICVTFQIFDPYIPHPHVFPFFSAMCWVYEVFLILAFFYASIFFSMQL